MKHWVRTSFACSSATGLLFSSFCSFSKNSLKWDSFLYSFGSDSRTNIRPPFGALAWRITNGRFLFSLSLGVSFLSRYLNEQRHPAPSIFDTNCDAFFFHRYLTEYSRTRWRNSWQLSTVSLSSSTTDNGMTLKTLLRLTTGKTKHWRNDFDFDLTFQLTNDEFFGGGSLTFLWVFVPLHFWRPRQLLLTWNGLLTFWTGDHCDLT